MIVLDASVVIAAAIRDGRTRDILLNARTQFVAPARLWEEIERNTDKIATAARLPTTHIQALLDDIALRVRTVHVDAYRHRRDDAQKRCRKAHAWGDDEYVALALALGAAVWTLDEDFGRVEGVEVVGAGDVE